MAKQVKVREDNYFAVQGWMVTELKLKGNALMLYAIIYGFSQTTNTAFTGSVDYLCEWLGGVSRPTVINTLDKVERIIELTSNSGKKEQFRVGDVVDINYRKPFDPRGVGYNGDAGLTGRIADIKDAVIYVDAGTLFHSNIVAITLDTVLYVAKAEHEHIEDMRRA